MKGNIFDIKHFAVHDGPGIRTTVFFKGCPLKCRWCHNPESISTAPQLGYLAHKCMHCGRCTAVCPTGAHTMTATNLHIFDRSKCSRCGECTHVCYGKNLTLYGREASLESVFRELLEDADFYASSGGGVTLSGGECLTQADFCGELLKRLKSEGIHTAVDTCGFVSKAVLDKVVSYTDLFLYDLKAWDEDVHIRCTGQSNRRILENLEYLDGLGCQTEIRIPFVPGYNADQIPKIGQFLKKLTHLTGIRILPYHNFSATKYASLAMENTLPRVLPSDSEITEAKKILLALGLKLLD